MTIHVKLFAILKDRAGLSGFDLELPPAATVESARSEIEARFETLRAYLPRVAWALNREYVAGDAILKDGDELALIPPVSGGTDLLDPRAALILLTPDPIDTAGAIAFVHDARAGGIDVFLGTTRAEVRPDGVELIALDYEAYEAMATNQLRDLARRANERSPIERLAIIHRVGRVALAQPSVLIAVACPHRSEAFEACRWLIDTLKAEVAIWKKEVWNDGAGTWVHR